MNLSQLISRRRLASRTGSILSRSLLILFASAGVTCVPTAYAGSPLAPQFVAAQSVVPTGSLSYPYRCAVDAQGNIYISNTQGEDILKETLTSGVYTESVVVPASYGLATPYGIAVDSSGNLFIVDNGHHRIVEATPSGSSYTLSVVTTTTTLSFPTGIAVDTSGTLYIADTGGGKILKEVPSGSSYTETALTYSSNFAQITGIAVDSSGDIFVSDIDNQAVYEETYSAGSYTPSTVPTSGLSYPYDLAVDSSGNLFISDFTHKRIVEEVNSSGSYTQSVFPSYNLGGALGITVDGNDNIYLADTFGFDIKKLSPAGGDFGSVNVGSSSGPEYALFQFSGGGGSETFKLGDADVLTQGVANLDYTVTGSGAGICNFTTLYVAGDSCAVGVHFKPQYPGSRSGAVALRNATYHVAATGYFKGNGIGPLVNFLEPEDFFAFDVIRVAGSFSPYDLTNPFAAAVDAGGNVYIADYNNNTVYKETWTAGGYVQTTVASGLNNPEDVAVDGSGAVYIVDSGNNQILKEVWSAGAWVQTPVITGLNFPAGIAVDGFGDVYYASFGDGAVYELVLSGGTYSSPITVTSDLNQPRKIAIDGSGNVYVADTGNSRVVMETWTGSGYTQTVLGSGMEYPYGVAVDAAGNVYVADTIHSRILKESLSGGVYMQAVLIPGPPAYGIAVDGAGNLYFPDPADATVFKIDFTQLHSLSFASTYVSITSSDSPQSFTVFNNGNAPLSISVPGAGANPSVPAGFNLDGSSTCPIVTSTDSAGMLATGANCNYAINFTPVAIGLARGPFVLTDNNLNVGGAVQGTTLSGTATMQTQTITFTALPSPVTYGVAPIALSATGGGSGNPVVFSVLSGPGTITGGNQLTVTAAGKIVVAASQAGGSGYWPAHTVTQTVVVNWIAQTITFTAPASPVTYGVAPITLSATGGASGNSVVFSVLSGPGTITGGDQLTVTGGGTIVVAANQAGNAGYSHAAQVSHIIVVNRIAQTITFTAPASPVTYGVAPITLSATGGASGNPVVFSVLSGPGTITGGDQLTVTGGGTIVVAANQAGNAGYSHAAQVSHIIVVNWIAQTITFTAPASPVTYGVAPITLSATGGASGNPVVFSVLSGPGTITGGNQLTVTGAGTIIVAANQAGNAGYSRAAQVSHIIVVERIAQTITFTAPASPVNYGVAAITLTATGGASGNPVTFSVTGPGHVVGNQLYVSAGTVVVTAHQAGGGNYGSATPVSNSITVNKAVLTVTARSASRNYGAANPGFGYTLSGFVNGDLAVHTVSGSPSLTTTATLTSIPGVYPITAAIGTLVSTNYNFTFVNATLTVNPLGPAHKPAFTPAATTLRGAQSVTIIDKTPNAVIYYTTNGDTPTAQSTEYTTAITVSSTETLKAIAIAPGYSNSAVATATYTVQ